MQLCCFCLHNIAHQIARYLKDFLTDVCTTKMWQAKQDGILYIFLGSFFCLYHHQVFLWTRVACLQCCTRQICINLTLMMYVELGNEWFIATSHSITLHRSLQSWRKLLQNRLRKLASLKQNFLKSMTKRYCFGCRSPDRNVRQNRIRLAWRALFLARSCTLFIPYINGLEIAMINSTVITVSVSGS